MRSLAALLFGILLGALLGSYYTAGRLRESAVKHGAAEWQVHTTKAGNPYKAFVWSSSHE